MVSSTIFTYDNKNQIFSINLDETDDDFLKEVIIALINLSVRNLIKPYKTLKKYEDLLLFSLTVSILSIFSLKKKIFYIKDRYLKFKNSFSNKKDFFLNLIAEKVIVTLDDKSFNFYVPITVKYAYLIDKSILNFFSSIISIFRKKSFICNNNEIEDNNYGNTE